MNEIDFYMTEARRMRAEAVGELLGAAFRRLGTLVLRLSGNDPLSRAEHEMEALSDEQLKDIGVYRCEIPYAVRHSREELDATHEGATVIPLPTRWKAEVDPTLPHAA
jgi:hypothetical protein